MNGVLEEEWGKVGNKKVRSEVNAFSHTIQYVYNVEYSTCIDPGRGK